MDELRVSASLLLEVYKPEKKWIGFRKSGYKGAKPVYPSESLWQLKSACNSKSPNHHPSYLRQPSCAHIPFLFLLIILISNYLSFPMFGFSEVEKKHLLSLSFSCTQKSPSQRISLRKWFEGWRPFWEQGEFPWKCSFHRVGLETGRVYPSCPGVVGVVIGLLADWP